mgnify:CR=1 FL=1
MQWGSFHVRGSSPAHEALVHFTIRALVSLMWMSARLRDSGVLLDQLCIFVICDNFLNVVDKLVLRIVRFMIRPGEVLEDLWYTYG